VNVSKPPPPEHNASRSPRVAAALLIGCLAVLWPAPSGADTALVGSQPVDGATVTSRPASVTLEFGNRIVPPAAVAVFAPNGSRVETGGPVVIGNRVQQQIATTADGEYRVAFRVMAEDRHPVEGGLTFTVDAPEGPGFWAANGAQLVGVGVVLLLVAAVAALRLRRRSASPSV
jgi:methionine-rich copper-binding protein CopC